jgi:hypothetical protein
MAGKRGRTWKFYLGYPLYLLVILLVAGEVTVRVMGYAPWLPEQHNFSVVPEGPFFRADEQLGFAGLPGRFEVTLQDTLHYTVTHNAEGYRITEPANVKDTLDRPEIWIFGCSFTHGFGVNDDESYPWLLQERFPAYKVRNLGMDAYGTVHACLQAEEMLGRGLRPALVILAYGAFHDQRNVNSRFWRKVLQGREMVEGLTYLQARFSGEENADRLTVKNAPLDYQPFPLMRYSALSHYLEMSYNNRQETELRSKEVTMALIGNLREMLNREGETPFLLAGIYRHPDTGKLLEHFARQGLSTVDISQDLDQPGMRILPSDGHPNAKGHRMMADELSAKVAEVLN